MGRTRWGLVVGIGFSVIRAPILQTTATKSEIVGAGMLTGMIIRLVTPGAEIPFTKGAPKNGRLHVRSPGVGHRDHKRNTHRPYWRPPPPACIRAGPGRTGAARRRHTVPDFHDFQTGGGLMARQVFALLTATVGTGTHMNKRQVEGVVHLEVFIGVEHAAQILH